MRKSPKTTRRAAIKPTAFTARSGSHVLTSTTSTTVAPPASGPTPTTCSNLSHDSLTFDVDGGTLRMLSWSHGSRSTEVEMAFEEDSVRVQRGGEKTVKAGQYVRKIRAGGEELGLGSGAPLRSCMRAREKSSLEAGLIAESGFRLLCRRDGGDEKDI